MIRKNTHFIRNIYVNVEVYIFSYRIYSINFIYAIINNLWILAIENQAFLVQNCVIDYIC